MIEFDASEVRKVVADMQTAEKASLPAVRAVLQKGALNIKNDWRNRWMGHSHAPRLPYDISYETKERAKDVIAVIGPTKGDVGSLGNIYEFGTPRSAPMPAGMPALSTEEPKFQEALAKALTNLLEG